MAIEIRIPLDEWQAAARAAEVADADERLPTGQVRLRSDGARRIWTVTDRVRGVVLQGGPDSGVYDVALSPALLEYAVLCSDVDEPDADGPSLFLAILDGDDHVAVIGPGGAVWHPLLDHEMPDLESFIATDDQIQGRATVIAVDLFYALHTASRLRQGGDGAGTTPFWMSIDGTDLLVGADWDECGRSFVNVAATDVSGDVVVELDPDLLRTVVDQFPPGTSLEVRIPRSNLLPVLFCAPALTSMIMPMSTEARRVRSAIEDLLKDTFGDLALDRDEHGDYLLTRRRIPLRGRLVTDEYPPVLTLFATVVSDVEPSAELLRELNDVNAQMSFASVAWIDGAVVASVDLVASTVDPDELVVAARRIHQLALEVAPTIAVVLGGSVVEDPEAARISLYRQTIIEAEVAPGRTEPITGPGGTVDWPFPGTVHVITGYNPQGVSRDDETNEEVNRAIANDVLERRGRFVHGAGTAADGSHTEPSLIVWGISRADATEMGWRADQDAVFEIDADEVRLISCIDDRVEGWPRLSMPGG